jgi:hypothetical protein
VHCPERIGLGEGEIPSMALNPTEREVVGTLIGSVRTIAVQLISLHLQLAAMRSLFAKKHMMTDDEFHAAFAELEAAGSMEERLDEFPDVMEDLFDELLRRLQAPQHLAI